MNIKTTEIMMAYKGVIPSDLRPGILSDTDSCGMMKVAHLEVIRPGHDVIQVKLPSRSKLRTTEHNGN